MNRIVSVTLDDRAREVADLLHRAFVVDGVVAFRGERVRVLREQIERCEQGLSWLFELEVLDS